MISPVILRLFEILDFSVVVATEGAYLSTLTALALITKGCSASIYAKGTRPALQVGHNFSFVLNISRFIDQAPDAVLTVAAGHELRRATEKEVVAIKDVLTSHTGEEKGFGAWQDGKAVTKDKKTTYLQIPKDQWRYFVIAFESLTSTIVDLERTLCIAPIELKIGFTLLHEFGAGLEAPTLVYHPGRLGSQVRAARDNKLPFFELTPSAVQDISVLHEQTGALDQNLSLKRLIEQMLDLDALPYESPLLFLGYFAILESLLTHQPKGTDTIDSITRQVKQKVLLLDNRWQPRIDYSPFPEKKPSAIWSKMYAYRSAIAHGAEPDFKSELKLLGDRSRALKLLKETVKGVLRQSLMEPQLLFDLRNC